MERVYSHHDRFMIQQAMAWLERHSVPCVLKNEFAGGAIGELSPLDSQPEVWVTDASWVPRARSLLASLEQSLSSGESWQCSKCGETNDASFELCWQCGHDSELPAGSA